MVKEGPTGEGTGRLFRFRPTSGRQPGEESKNAPAPGRGQARSCLEAGSWLPDVPEHGRAGLAALRGHQGRAVGRVEGRNAKADAAERDLGAQAARAGDGPRLLLVVLLALPQRDLDAGLAERALHREADLRVLALPDRPVLLEHPGLAPGPVAREQVDLAAVVTDAEVVVGAEA